MAKIQGKRKRTVKRQDSLYLIAYAVAVIVIVMLLLLPKEPKFTPPPFDTSAVTGEPSVSPQLGWSQMSIRSGFLISVCGVLEEKEGTVPVWLYNHPSNDCWVKLRMTDTEGRILGETGLLKPGEYVQNITLDTIPQKNTTVILKLMGYEPDTYYSAGSVGLETTLIIP